MRSAADKREALIGILNRAYDEIRTVEAEYSILVSEQDLRPRIEFFHDAVRLLSHDPDAAYEKTGRLSVESLAYDLSCLRHLQDKPLTKLASLAQHHAAFHRSVTPNMGRPPAGTLRLSAPNAPPPSVRTPTPTTRAELADRYKTYTILFAGLFSEPVDRNHMTRTSDLNASVEELAQVERAVKQFSQGQIEDAQLEELVDQLEHEDLKAQLMALLHERSQKKHEKMNAMAQLLKQSMQTADLEIAIIEKAHMNYLTGQMMLYQDSKDMVKKLAAQGMNLAGQYLDTAMQNSAGRGGRGA